MGIDVTVTGQPPIAATVTDEKISVAISETQIDVSVEGGVGPSGPSGPPGTTDFTQLVNVPATFPPAAHQHVVGDITGLQASLDGKQAAGTYATLVNGKVPTNQLPPLASSWDDLTGKPSAFPPSSHTHTASAITDFATAVIAAAPPTIDASLLTEGTLNDARLPGNVVLTGDARLSDARSPTSHAASHADNGSDPITIVASQVSDFTSAAQSAVPTPTLAIGTVTSGETAGAAITGTAPNYTLDLTLVPGGTGPQGEQGPPGNSGSSLSVSAGPTSDSYTVSDSSGGSTVVYAQAGATGPQGPPGLRYIGSVAGRNPVYGDVVTYQGSAWVYQSETGGFEYGPPNAGWAILAEKGDAGASSWNDITDKPTLFDGSYTSLANVPASFAPSAHTQNWSTITSTPTSLSGYGITDAVSSSDSRLSDARTPTAHTHSAADITSGIVATARLGSGTATPANFLRGDGTWATAGSSSASDLTSGTLSNSRMTTRARAAMNLYLWSSFR